MCNIKLKNLDYGALQETLEKNINKINIFNNGKISIHTYKNNKYAESITVSNLENGEIKDVVFKKILVKNDEMYVLLTINNILAGHIKFGELTGYSDYGLYSYISEKCLPEIPVECILVLESLYIDEKYRGNNIGTVLVSYMEEFFTNNNYKGIIGVSISQQATEFYKNKCHYDISDVSNYDGNCPFYFVKRL